MSQASDIEKETSQHERWMREALIEAQKADEANEVPVGAVVVLEGKIIGRGFNQPITGCDPTAHAEIIALRNASLNVQNYRLTHAVLYVTIEPCTMCAGAIVHSRVSQLVYGATEPKAGVAESQGNLFDAPYFNHQLSVVGGILMQECTDAIQRFFQRRRSEKKAQKLLSNRAQQPK